MILSSLVSFYVRFFMPGEVNVSTNVESADVNSTKVTRIPLPLGAFPLRSVQVLIIALTILFFTVLHVTLSMKMKQLPSCLYGCDHYSHLGTIYHLANGGSVFDNGQIPWAKPWVPQFYHLVVTGIGWLTGVDSMTAQIWTSVFLFVIAAPLFWILTYQLFKNHAVSLFFVCGLATGFPLYKYTPFATNLILPGFVFLFFRFISSDRPSRLLTIGTGILYGITGYSNTVTFLVINLLVFFSGCYVIVSRKRKSLPLADSFYNFSMLVITGLPLALLYWWWPLANRFKQLNPSTFYGNKDFSNSSVIFAELKQSFLTLFYLQTPGVGTVVIFIGLLGLLLPRVRAVLPPFLVPFTLILYLVSLVGMTHFLITIPVAGMAVFPQFFSYYLHIPQLTFLCYVSLVTVEHLVKHSLSRRTLLCFFYLLFGYSCFQGFWYNAYERQFASNAFLPIPKHLEDAARFVKQQTSIDDVFLTSKELCFALNGLSGRKCMVYRTTHTDPFSDVWTNQVDAAVILYGNDREQKEQLLKKYNVSYLYWNAFWEESEFLQSAQGLRPFDPLLVPDRENFAEKLKANYVKFTVGDYWFDPMLQSKDVPTLHGLMISPDNYRSAEQPWKADLDELLEEVWSFSEGDTKQAAIYRVRKK